MKLKILIYQDGEDIKNGMVQLSINENNNSAYIYFSIAQWQELKQAVNKLEQAENHQDLATELTDNPLHALYQDGKAIEMIFGGLLTIELYFQGADKKFWRFFKKAVNDFTPEEVS